MNPIWEYSTKRFVEVRTQPFSPQDNEDEILNGMGKDGWELTFVFKPHDGVRDYYFKRKVINQLENQTT